MTKANRQVVKFHRSLVVLLLEYIKLVLPITILFLTAVLLSPQLAAHGVSLPPSIVIIYRIICVLALLEIARRYFNDVYILGIVRVIHFHGRASFNLKRLSICYADIREIKIRQNLCGRFFDYGTLIFATIANSTEMMELKDVAHPHEIAHFAQRHSYVRHARELAARPVHAV